MKVGIIIQARMSSQRLPGKVLKKLAGREVLWHMVKRCQASKLAREVVVATSTDISDNPVYNFCVKNGFEVFRGSLENVLLRYYECAEKFNFDVVVRVTGDCPLIDPSIIDETIGLFKLNDKDYVSNALKRIFPRGLDCEVFSFKALEEAAGKASSDYEKEHVTPYLIKNKSTLPLKVNKDFAGDFRLTLDTPEDYKLLSLIYNEFYQSGKIIDVRQVIPFLKSHPEIVRINADVKQK